MPQSLQRPRVFRSALAWSARLGDWVLSTDRRRRIRLAQWLISVLVYAAAASATWAGACAGLIDRVDAQAWIVFIAVQQTFFYLALRSGWSVRFDDPALTAAQIVVGVVAVEWGYAITGSVRSATLLPLLLIFTFGAFSLGWRRIAGLTAFALASLVACVTWMHVGRHGMGNDGMSPSRELPMDVANVVTVMILLPATSWLSARLSGLRSRLQSQRAALTAALLEVQRLATHDELTGLFNRRHMVERLSQACAHARRHGQAWSIALVDLDHFKRVNDLYGHACGDEVLRVFAREASAGLRADDVMARWGGEEFLLLLADTPGEPARASVERLLSRIRLVQMAPGVTLTFSAGVTEHRPGEEVAETIACADGAMYAAKLAGRNAALLQ